METCPECGSVVGPSDETCSACGHPLQGGAEGDGTAVAEPQGTDRIEVPADPFEMDTFEFTLKYPFANGYRALILGSLLVVASFLIVPMFMLMGYSYRIGRSAALGRATPPEIGDWVGLLVDGFRFFVAMVLVGAVVTGGFVGLLLADYLAFAAIWYFVGVLAIFAVQAVFVGTGSLRGTYGNVRFLRFIGTTNFWIGLAYLIGVSLLLYVGFLVVMFLLAITIVGIILWIPLYIAFYAYTIYVTSALWGRIYHDAAEAGAVDSVGNSDEVESSW